MSSSPFGNCVGTELSLPLFHSILFDRPPAETEAPTEPPSFRDLGLDQVVDAVFVHEDEYLGPLFWRTLPDAAAVRYRHEVFRDLERADVAAAVRAFTHEFGTALAFRAEVERLGYRHLGNRTLLDAASAYCHATVALAEALVSQDVRSAGLTAFRERLREYIASEAFQALQSEAVELEHALSQVRYSLLVRGPRVTVRKFDPGPDYGAEVTTTFARFQAGALENHRVPFSGELSMGHVQEWILERVARFYPKEFAALDTFRVRRAGFADETLITFAHEVRFYLVVLAHVEGLQRAGLSFCYPRLTDEPTDMHADGAFDQALAIKCVMERRQIVPNDVRLSGAERVIVVTGPNQGGKTTFARTLGQLHYLASLGVPVPGSDAELVLADDVFTHFDREEVVGDLRGKLEDELTRVRTILHRATARSVIIMNESFSSTTLDDSRLLGRRVLDRILRSGALCVYVTFVDDLASPREGIVSMVAGVDPDDPAERTFNLQRAPASGRAYAEAIARKYGLTPAQLHERMAK